MSSLLFCLSSSVTHEIRVFSDFKSAQKAFFDLSGEQRTPVSVELRVLIPDKNVQHEAWTCTDTNLLAVGGNKRATWFHRKISA